MTKSMFPVALLAGAAMLASLPAAYAAPVFVNGIAIDGALLDATGAPGANQGRVGFFSDIYYDRGANQWWGLSDRGPGGGTLDYGTRVQRFSLDVDPANGAISNFKVLETVQFTDGSGNALTGKAPNPTSSLGRSLDPEGFVVNHRTGTFLVSDEYGPAVREFDRNGVLLRTFTTPDNLVPRNAGSGTPNYANDTGNTAGKRTNRGFEGLALSPDGKFAFAVLQSPMLDEGGTGNGVYARIVKFDTTTGTAVGQYAYKMETASQGRGVSALVAINDHEFMVLERNNRGIGIGATLSGADKNVYKIDLNGATDVSNITLPASGTTLPAGVTAVAKGAKIIDLDANTLAALGNKSPEKWEGLAIGPQLDNGGYLILAGTDSDYSVTQNGSNTQFDVYLRMTDPDPYASSIQCPLDQVTGCFFTSNNAATTLTSAYILLPGVLHAYAASAADLAGFVAPIPEPATALLALLGLAGIAASRRTRRLV